MGVIHKLKPEIKAFILEKKKESPILSCRNLVLLAEKELGIKISKSSINSLFREAGLSMPVGRRPKKKRKEIKIEEPVAMLPDRSSEVIVEKPEEPLQIPLEIKIEKPVIQPIQPSLEAGVELPLEQECTGAILLKAADYLMGGKFKLDPLIDKELSGKDISSYLNDSQIVKEINSAILRVNACIREEVRCLKITLSDGNVLYLDGQLHTVWSTPYIPYDFNVTICDIEAYINKYLKENALFTLFMAPDTDAPTEEFFNFILSLELRERKIASVTLCGNELEELKTIKTEEASKGFFVFGLWPWQFLEYRNLKKVGEFKPLLFAPLNKEFYLAQIEIELSQPIIQQRVTLRGYALKTTPLEKPRLLIVSNSSEYVTDPGNMLSSYLNRWPNLEEGLQDYRQKLETFSYLGGSQGVFSTENTALEAIKTSDAKTVFLEYLKILDLFVRRYFLPAKYKEASFPTIKEHFYDLKAILKKEKDCVKAIFKPPEGLRYLKDLQYAIARANEREVESDKGIRLWLLL